MDIQLILLAIQILSIQLVLSVLLFLLALLEPVAVIQLIEIT